MSAKRFKMDTAAFCSIWNNHLGEEDRWTAFVINCFERFTSENEFNNRELLHNEDKTWKKWDNDKKYDFLSERCYSKAIAIQRSLKKKEAFEIALPDGYLTRKGSGKGKRLTSKDLMAFFTQK